MNLNEDIRDILAKALEGNQDAYKKLYNLYAVPLYRYIYMRLRDSRDAEDLLQDVFIKMYTRLDSLVVDDRGLLPYMYTIARNLTIDHIRKKNLEVTSDKLEFVADLTQNPQEVAEKVETEKYIERLFLRLPPDVREVMTLRYISGLSNNEISQIVDKSEESLRQIQSRAIKSLRSYIEKNHE